MAQSEFGSGMGYHYNEGPGELDYAARHPQWVAMAGLDDQIKQAEVKNKATLHSFLKGSDEAGSPADLVDVLGTRERLRGLWRLRDSFMAEQTMDSNEERGLYRVWRYDNALNEILVEYDELYSERTTLDAFGADSRSRATIDQTIAGLEKKTDELYKKRFTFASRLPSALIDIYEAQRPHPIERQKFETAYAEDIKEAEESMTEAIQALEQADIALRGPDPDTPCTSQEGYNDREEYIKNTLRTFHEERDALRAIMAGQAPLSHAKVLDAWWHFMEYYGESKKTLTPTPLEKIARFAIERGILIKS